MFERLHHLSVFTSTLIIERKQVQQPRRFRAPFVLLRAAAAAGRDCPGPSPGHHHTAPASCPSAEFARELWRSVAWIGAAYAMCIGREGRAGTALGISRYLMAWRKAKPHHLDLKHKNNCMQNQNQNQNSAERCNAVHGIARHYMTLCDAARLFAALHVNA